LVEDPVISAVRAKVASYQTSIDGLPEGSRAALNGRAWQLPWQYAFEHGRLFRGATRPKGEPVWPLGKCFEAAYTYVINHPDHFYVEGYAQNPLGDDVLAHAWAVTPTGVVVDVVWPESESRSYLGVPFSASQAGELRPFGSVFGDILTAAAKRALEEPPEQ
jgi:hypothetical protein